LRAVRAQQKGFKAGFLPHSLPSHTSLHREAKREGGALAIISLQLFAPGIYMVEPLREESPGFLSSAKLLHCHPVNRALSVVSGLLFSKKKH